MGGKKGSPQFKPWANISLAKTHQKSRIFIFLTCDMLGDEVEFVEYVFLRSGKLKPCWKTCADEFSKEVET